MITLIGVWLAWRVVRAIARVAVVIVLVVLVLGSVAGRHDTRHVSHRLVRQVEHTSEKALR